MKSFSEVQSTSLAVVMDLLRNALDMFCVDRRKKYIQYKLGGYLQRQLQPQPRPYVENCRGTAVARRQRVLVRMSGEDNLSMRASTGNTNPSRQASRFPRTRSRRSHLESSFH